LHSSSNIIKVVKSRKMKSVKHVTRVGEEDECIRGSGGKAEGKLALGRHRRREDNNIKIYPGEIGRGGIN
jgi:hypothetical protein